MESCSAKICRSILLQKKFHISKQFYLLVICLYFFCFKTKEKCWKVLKNVKTLRKKKLLFKKFFMRNNYKITGIGGIRNFQVSLHEQNQYLLAVFQFAWLRLSDKLSVVFLNSFENVSEIISETWTCSVIIIPHFPRITNGPSPTFVNYFNFMTKRWGRTCRGFIVFEENRHP